MQPPPSHENPNHDGGPSARDSSLTADKILRSEGYKLSDSVYHGPVGDLVRLIGPHSEADPAALITNTLVALGNIIGPGPHATVEGARHPGRLFAVHVGETSKGRKGTALSRILSILELVDPEWARERVASGLSSGEGLIHALNDDTSPDQETANSDRRIMAVEPEFASVLRRMRRDSNTLSTVIRESWDSGNLRTLTRNDPLRVRGAHVGIIGHVTRPDLLKHLDETEIANGFGNRFLWVLVRRSKTLPFGGGEIDTRSQNDVVLRLRHAVSAARGISRVTWGDAADAWTDIYPELSDGKPGICGALTSRAEAQVLRLAVLYAVLDGCDTIGMDHLGAAYGVWTYAEKSVYRIFDGKTGDRLADRFYEVVREHGRIGRTELSEALGRNNSASELDRAEAILVKLERILVEREGRRKVYIDATREVAGSL